MKAEQIKELFAQFEATASEYEGIECWSARELQALLGYSKWENFEKVIKNSQPFIERTIFDEGTKVSFKSKLVVRLQFFARKAFKRS